MQISLKKEAEQQRHHAAWLHCWPQHKDPSAMARAPQQRDFIIFTKIRGQRVCVRIAKVQFPHHFPCFRRLARLLLNKGQDPAVMKVVTASDIEFL